MVPYFDRFLGEEAVNYWRRREAGDLPTPFRGFNILYSAGQEADAEAAKALLLKKLQIAKPRDIPAADLSVRLFKKPYKSEHPIGESFTFDLEAMAKLPAA